jgi:DNA excision repair protein ERCC-5
MGVTGLWTVVQPCARPVKLETLNRKRLAIDASIWIYQFLKAVRDKEGNALRNSHVVGFFRRICKLLYFGIKPVFVFDGGAPILKRQTITARKQRREGRREDAVRTAGKLLAVQIQRIAEEEEAKRKQPAHNQQEEEVPDEPLYVDEIFMTEKEKSQNRKFRKKDAYHLPELDVSLEAMGGPDDPRIMSQEELEEYARQFYSGEVINLYDFSKIDFDGQFFLSLPASDRYNILNAARLRSRLRMGYSKEQLDSLFPDRMAFSRFQIERVKERNDLTQRLMNINGMNGESSNVGQRIAGERGREYVLVKDNGVEGGWALGVVSNRDAGQRDKPIDVDQYGQEEANPEGEDEWESDGDAFEDVPIEGVNRLPRLPVFQNGIFDESIEQHAREMAENRKVVESRREVVERQVSRDRFVKDDSLFVEGPSGLMQEAGDSIEPEVASEDEDLCRAIEMSLESPKDDLFDDGSPVNDISPNLQMAEYASSSHSQSDENDMDFAMALARSKRPQAKTTKSRSENLFSGPLPFETLKPRKISNKKTAPKMDVQENNDGSEKRAPVVSEQYSMPLPPWFTAGGGSKKDFIADDLNGKPSKRDQNLETTHSYTFSRVQPPDVIDVDRISKPENVIDLDDDDDVLSSLAGPQKQAGKPSSPVSEIADKKIMEPSVLTVSNINQGRDTHKTLSTTDSMSEGEQIDEWEPTDVEDSASISGLEKKPVSQGSPPSRETTFSPEFEDIEMRPTSKAPEVFPDAEVRLLSGVDSQPVINQEPLVEYEAGFSDPEDEDLVRQLAAEAEEHARFASTFNKKTPAENALDFEQELKQLRAQQKKDRRDADEVSQVMVSECQQLLRFFGLPYITAPMEAEAQCAELVSLGLVDGIVTDDSDIFLFGGTRVYKNMFNQSKFVECYLANDLEKEYALDRRKLIRFAHLLGSDYTEGIPGVGPVTALEIVTEFGRLEDFRDWWTQTQMGAEIPNDSHSAFRKKFRKNVTKLFLPPSFPDTRVDIAYLQPEVDSDPSVFQWGVPDLIGLRGFLMSTVGWSQERTDEVLVPVIRDMNRREQEGTQANITNFLSGTQGAGAFAPRLATEGKGRLGKAFNRLRQEAETRKKGATNANTNSDGDGDAAAEQAQAPTPTPNTDDNSQPGKKRRGPANKKGEGKKRKKKKN